MACDELVTARLLERGRAYAQSIMSIGQRHVRFRRSRLLAWGFSTA